MRKILRDTSGMALLMALGAIALLAAITVQLGVAVNQGITGAAIQAEDARLDARLWSLINVARAALFLDQQENGYESPHDRWAQLDSSQLAKMFDGELSEIRVENLAGRLQINALVTSPSRQQAGKKASDREKQEQLQRELWLRFLQQDLFAVPREEAEVLVDSLSDWLDVDDMTRAKGAETSFYQGLDQPYKARNGKALSVEELLLIKGMTRKILYGDEEHSGIIDYLTIYGEDGKINLSSAPFPVLMAMHSGMSEDLARRLIKFRSEKGNRELLSRPDWYQEVDGFPGDIRMEKGLLSEKGKFFGIHLAAVSAAKKKNAMVVVERQENREQNILAWKVE